MRALVCTRIGGEQFLEVRDDWPTSPCGPNQVRIDVAAASVNFPDVLIIRDQYQIKKEPPFVPGNECAGVVTEVGADVDGFRVGDRVLALLGVGAFAEEVVVSVPPVQVHRIPDEMPFDDAAAFNLTYGTAGHALVQRGNVQRGETVLITGAAGGCGSAAIQIAKALGATVVVTASAGKTAPCKALGADRAVDYVSEDFVEAAREVTGGRGVDVVLDVVGGEYLDRDLAALAPRGRIVQVGTMETPRASINLGVLMTKRATLIGTVLRSRPIEEKIAVTQRFTREVLPWFERGVCKPVIDRRFPLDEIAEAHRVLEANANVGKIAIDVRP